MPGGKQNRRAGGGRGHSGHSGLSGIPADWGQPGRPRCSRLGPSQSASRISARSCSFPQCATCLSEARANCGDPRLRENRTKPPSPGAQRKIVNVQGPQRKKAKVLMRKQRVRRHVSAPCYTVNISPADRIVPVTVLLRMDRFHGSHKGAYLRPTESTRTPVWPHC